jgi:CheY-like chemotaxis protein
MVASVRHKEVKVMARILVIDDEELVRFTIKKALEKAGHEVVEAVNGNDGIEVYKNSPVDLIITDIIMPQKEGVETIVELRRDDPDVKIIAISGGGRTGNTDYLQLARDFGARHVLRKPFGRQELLVAVQDVLGTAA